jgi:hypothetical protein
MAVEIIKRVHVIACGVLGIDLRDLAGRLGLEVSLQFLPGGLHSTPLELRRQLQEAIDEATARRMGDMIAIGYGVCGLGTVGIHARTIPLAIPRVHDCIALFLGSDRAYKEQFSRYPGTYYISAGWVQEKATPQSSGDNKSKWSAGTARRTPTRFDISLTVGSETTSEGRSSTPARPAGGDTRTSPEPWRRSSAGSTRNCPAATIC